MPLERKLGIGDLKVGDIVCCEGKYITSKGYYFTMGRGFRVKRINRKSITLAPLNFITKDSPLVNIYPPETWIEGDIVRIPRQAIEECGHVRREVEPLFGRDNDRC